MSFISVEPHSRALLDNHTNYLLSQFDTQHRIIADRYLAFFRERSINLTLKSRTVYTNPSIFRRSIETT